mmetsp:Transcript_103406/g.269965  ORF Transcript_103406/g.269965 Transcript_103406/m.269965 type:complete len:206 (+) Transcript_103406:1595-2212(+)
MGAGARRGRVHGPDIPGGERADARLVRRSLVADHRRRVRGEGGGVLDILARELHARRAARLVARQHPRDQRQGAGGLERREVRDGHEEDARRGRRARGGGPGEEGAGDARDAGLPRGLRPGLPPGHLGHLGLGHRADGPVGLRQAPQGPERPLAAPLPAGPGPAAAGPLLPRRGPGGEDGPHAGPERQAAPGGGPLQRHQGERLN